MPQGHGAGQSYWRGGGSPDRDPRQHVHVALEQFARNVSAVAVAAYETDYFETPGGLGDDPSQQPAGFGELAYFVDSWPFAPLHSAHRELHGFPAWLDASHLPGLRDVIVGDTGALPVVGDQYSVLAGAATRAAEATAALIVPVRPSNEEKFGTLLVFHFASEDQAFAVSVGGAVAEVPESMANVRRAAAEHAAARLLDTLAVLQREFAHKPDTALGAPEDEIAHFDAVVGARLAEIAALIGCPDLRVYLNDDPGRLDLRAAALSPQGEVTRFRLRHAAPSGKPPNSVVVTPQGNGPLAWVLANRHRLGLHNREALDAAPNAQNRYPGMRAENVAGTDDTGRMVDVLPRPARGEVEYCPSLLTHPITAGDRMLGLLVANGREGAPFVFRDWDDKGLGIIAQMLGGHWLSAHQRRIEREELAVRRRAADITGEFVRAVPRLSGRPDGYHALLVAALDAACRIAAVDVIADIRVYDDAAHEFRFDRGLVSARERERFATLRGFNAPFPATPGRQADARNGAEYVMRGGMPAVVDAENPPHWFKNRFPGEFRHAIFVPVFRGANPTEPAALIDVRIVGDGAFPISCADALHGLAMLLDLSLGFSASRRELDATVAKLRAGEEWQNAAFEDLSHQILSPQRNAMTQISALLRLTRKVEEPFLREDLNRAVLIARGQVRRANRVGRAASLFAELSRTRTIATAAKAVPLPRDAIIASLINLVSDQRLLSPSRKGLKFDLDDHSVRLHYADELAGDIGLFEQMVSNLLENAEKYSLQGTEVTIAARRVNEEFILEVANYGYDILDHEVARLTSRNFRGQEARDRVASGHGIGLWLVKALAESFGGTLRITVGHQKQAPHRFALVFPRRGGGEG